jgi:hypothetical protein
MSADNTPGRREIGPVDKVPFTIDEIERLNDENEALRIDLAAAYCRMDDMEGYNE